MYWFFGVRAFAVVRTGGIGEFLRFPSPMTSLRGRSALLDGRAEGVEVDGDARVIPTLRSIRLLASRRWGIMGHAHRSD